MTRALHSKPSARRSRPQLLKPSNSINYGVPAFKYRGRPLVSFAAAKNHCAFYVQSPAVMEAHRDELVSYDTSKGTLRFAPDAPPAAALVTKLVKARMAETDATAKT